METTDSAARAHRCKGKVIVLSCCFVFAEFQWQQRISPKRESKVINKGLIDETIAFPLRQHRSTVCVVCCAQSLNHVRLFATLRTVAHQAPLSMGFSRQEYWRGLPCPLPRDLPNPGIEPRSPKLQADSLPSEPPGKPTVCHRGYKTTRIPCAKIKLKKKSDETIMRKISQTAILILLLKEVDAYGAMGVLPTVPQLGLGLFDLNLFCLFLKQIFYFISFCLFDSKFLDFSTRQLLTQPESKLKPIKFLMPVFLHNTFKYFPPRRGDSGYVSAAQ